MLTVHDTPYEASVIQNEILQVEQMISQLRDKRASLLRKLNSVCSSTGTLPPETLSHVFEYFVTGGTPYYNSDTCRSIFGPSTFIQDNDNRRLFLLGRVSSYWREVAWSTPSLWTYMSVGPKVGNAPGILGMLKLHLRGIKDLPFSIDFSFSSRSTWGLAFIQLTKSIEDVITREEILPKIRCLRIVDPPKWWFESMLNKCNHLESISLRDIDGEVSLNDLPQLHHVTIHGPSHIQLPWTAITTLDLEMVPVNRCAYFLMRCPNLVKFRSKSPDIDTNHQETVSPNSPTTLYHLQDLHWTTSGGCRWCLDTFQHACLPALRTLTWDNNRGSATEVEGAIQTLFRNHRGTLQTVRMTRIEGWTMSFAQYVFSHLRSVQSLHLTFSDVTSVFAVICALCPHEDGRDPVPSSLNELSIDTVGSRSELHRVHSRFGTEYSSRILKICRARCMVPGFKLRLALGQLGVYWAPGVLEELRKMIEGGFNLWIGDNGKTLMGVYSLN